MFNINIMKISFNLKKYNHIENITSIRANINKVALQKFIEENKLKQNMNVTNSENESIVKEVAEPVVVVDEPVVVDEVVVAVDDPVVVDELVVTVNDPVVEPVVVVDEVVIVDEEKQESTSPLSESNNIVIVNETIIE